MREIGKNIRAARLRRGQNQDQLGERLHVSRQTVSNYETGRSRPAVYGMYWAGGQFPVVFALLGGALWLSGGPERPAADQEEK